VVLRSFRDLPRLCPPEPAVEALRKTSRFLDRLVREKTQHLNQLHAALLETYQARAKTMFDELQSATALAFFAQYPDPHDLDGVSTTRLANLLAKAARGKLGRGKGSRAWNLAANVLDQTRDLIQAPPIPAAHVQAEIIRGLGQQIQTAKKLERSLIRQLEKSLLPQTGQHLETLIGIDTRAAGIIQAESLGRNFPDHDAYARFNGTAPAKNSTGGKQKHRARHDCNHRLKRIFYLIALTNSQHDPLGQAYYQNCIARGLTKSQALKRLGRRLSDIVFAMLRDHAPYRPQRAQLSMASRNQKNQKQKGEVAPAHHVPQRTRGQDISLASPVDNSITGGPQCQKTCTKPQPLLT
jgi:transposase